MILLVNDDDTVHSYFPNNMEADVISFSEGFLVGRSESFKPNGDPHLSDPVPEDVEWIEVPEAAPKE